MRDTPTAKAETAEKKGAAATADDVRGGQPGARAAVAGLDAAVDAVASLDVATFDDREVTEFLAAIRRPLDRLTAVRTQLAGEVTRRTVAATPADRRGGARRRAQREIAEKLGLTAWEAKRTTEAGSVLDDHEDTADAFSQGDVREDHVRLIGNAMKELMHLSPQRRREIEAELLALARTRDAVAFGRDVRRITAREAPVDAAVAARRRHMKRSVRVTDTEDGGLAFSGLLYGVQAETARVALDAFRRPDTPGEHRTPQQRTADGFEQLCAAALRANEAPAQHGSRPQVLVVVSADELTADHGRARFASGQPVAVSELLPLLADSTFGRILMSANGTPLEASEMSRTVPAGLWRALVVRDGGCTWEGCDAPAAWCDVAHGHRPFRDRGRLAPDNAALLCRRHHRQFDAGGWRIEIAGDQVRFQRAVTPRGGADDGAPPPPSRVDATSEPPSRGGSGPPQSAPGAGEACQLPLDANPPPAAHTFRSSTPGSAPPTTTSPTSRKRAEIRRPSGASTAAASPQAPRAP